MSPEPFLAENGIYTEDGDPIKNFKYVMDDNRDGTISYYMDSGYNVTNDTPKNFYYMLDFAYGTKVDKEYEIVGSVENVTTFEKCKEP